MLKRFKDSVEVVEVLAVAAVAAVAEVVGAVAVVSAALAVSFVSFDPARLLLTYGKSSSLRSSALGLAGFFWSRDRDKSQCISILCVN